MRHISTFVMLAVGLSACGNDNGGDNKNGDTSSPFSPTISSGGGGGGSSSTGGMGAASKIVVNLSGAIGLMSMQSQSLGLASDGDQSGLLKIESDGSVADVIKPVMPEGSDATATAQSIPAVKSMAESPTGDMYLHFESSFMTLDPKDSTKTYNCNLFRVAGGTIDKLRAAGAGEQSLECLDRDTYVQNWDITRDSVFQFDGAGNIYYPGWNESSRGQELKMVSADGWTKKTIINANIHFRDYFITPSGGAFYVGESSTPSSNGSGGFFRYVTPQGSLQQISDGFWDFKFEPIRTETGDKAVFYGPDPTVESNEPWKSACLFEYDPDLYDIDLDNPVSKAISPLLTCGDDLYGWIYMRRASDEAAFGKGPNALQGAVNTPTQAWVDEFVDRCESDDQVFAGGGHIDRIHQNSKGEIFVIGSINKKKAGVVSCNAQVYGQYCLTKAGTLDLAANTPSLCAAIAESTWSESTGTCSLGYNDRAACILNHGTWEYNWPTWLYNQTGDVCAQVGDDDGVRTVTDDTVLRKVLVDGRTCSAEGSNNGDYWSLMTEYKGLARVDRETKTLVPLMSDTTEEAVRFWFIDDAAYYLSKKSGVYRLKRLVEGDTATTLLTNFEVYQLAKSGRPGNLLFNGLDFATNAYLFGNLDVTSKVLEKNEKVTGKVDSLVIFD